MEKPKPPHDFPDNEARSRARRRLLKLGVYLTPTVLSLTTFLDSVYADKDKITPRIRQQIRIRVTTRIRVITRIRVATRIRVSGDFRPKRSKKKKK